MSGIVDTKSPRFEPKNRSNRDKSNLMRELPICPADDLIRQLHRICQPNDSRSFVFECGYWMPGTGASVSEWLSIDCSRSCHKILKTCLDQLLVAQKYLHATYGMAVPGLRIDGGFASINRSGIPVDEMADFIEKIGVVLAGRSAIQNWQKQKMKVLKVPDADFQTLFDIIAGKAQELAEFVGKDALEIICGKDEKRIIKNGKCKGCPQRPTYNGRVCGDRADGILKLLLGLSS